MVSLRALPLFAAAALLSSIGCAVRTPADEVGDDSTSTSTDTNAETGTDTSDEVCDPPANAAPMGAAPIRVTNNRDVQIYVMPYSSFGCNYGKVEIEVEGEPVLWHHEGTYAYDCSASLCDWGCSNGGAKGWIINPGETAELTWTGGLWRRVPLPQACADAMECLNDPGDTCEVLELLDEGTPYLASVNLSETCPIPNECEACTEGVCEVSFEDEPFVGPDTESFSAGGSYPGGAEVVVE